MQCKNVLIEDSASIGAADAGIYVGQSKNIIVRRNRAEFNVAGIEIENSENADVYENTATKNAGGLLVFSLPDLPVKTSQNARVFNNKVFANNTPNFAPKGNIVAKVPTGTGILVMATHHVDVYEHIRDNNTVNVSIISYTWTGNPIQDPDYYPYVAAVYVHDNKILGGGTAPVGMAGETLAPKLGKPLPAILWDGIWDSKREGGAQICIQNNGDAGFADYDAAGRLEKISRDLKSARLFAAAAGGGEIPEAGRGSGGTN